MTSTGKPVAVITGGSSGIGRAAAELFSRRGYVTYELSRSNVETQGVVHIWADVTDEGSVRSAIERIMDASGKIDVLVCNAGWGISGAVEFTELREAQRLFDVNFFGTLRCIQAVIPHMRHRKAGRIVCLSSVAAPFAIPYQAFYSCSKAAVNDLVMALRCELLQFGIGVSAVMPGDAKTGFTGNRAKSYRGDDAYGGAIGRAVAAMERDEVSGMTPMTVAERIYLAATAKKPRPFYVVGGKYRLFVLLGKILPASAQNWIIGKMYG